MKGGAGVDCTLVVQPGNLVLAVTVTVTRLAVLYFKTVLGMRLSPLEVDMAVFQQDRLLSNDVMTFFFEKMDFVS